MIYVDLEGRIGNQLFIYAFADALRLERGRNEKIVINDSSVLSRGWVDSLSDYDLDNVEFVHDTNYPRGIRFKMFVLRVIYHFVDPQNFTAIEKLERCAQPLLALLGIISYQNGYMNLPKCRRENVYVRGYFQSPRYFKNIDSFISRKFGLMDRIDEMEREEVKLIKARNSICISIKVEHNIGSSIYDVCSREYWESAIKHITDRVENPLFFICSDNVDYVRKHLIDTKKYDTICQDKQLPVHLSLAMMACCKHFIIGNTSFGWWAQHMSRYPGKIVVAPSRWYKVALPVDIYEPNWHLIEV